MIQFLIIVHVKIDLFLIIIFIYTIISMNEYYINYIKNIWNMYEQKIYIIQLIFNKFLNFLKKIKKMPINNQYLIFMNFKKNKILSLISKLINIKIN